MTETKYEDMITKRVMASFAQSGLRFLGITEEVREPAETETIMLQMQDLLMDYNFVLTDGNYLHLEFQSTHKGADDLRRFRKYEAFLSDSKKKDVYTYVVYTNDVKHPQTRLRTGFSEYQVRAVLLKDYDSQQVLQEVQEALDKNNALNDEELTALAFVPVMSHKAERAAVLSEAVKISHKIADEQKKIDIQSILFAFANKFLTGGELERIKEEIVMTQLGQMIYEDGIERGMERGIAKGMEKGMERGMEKGIAKGKLEDARELLDILPDELIAEKIKLPLELVQKLRREQQG